MRVLDGIMRTCRLDECYDGQAILGGDLGDAILLGYFSNMSVSNHLIFS